MNGVMASALTVHSYYLILTNHSLEKGPRHRSPNKGHIGQEMAGKFGLFVFGLSKQFFSTSGKDL